ncbi:MAG: hypothetical protein QNJ44_14360 [Rhodobacter sp.]|nr:hypothetical protein [Rhodobacter sp.]
MKSAVAALILLATQAPAQSITTLPAGELDWARTPEGVAFAQLHGDRFAGEYMAMVTLPAGLVSPAHRKGADMFGVVVSGAMTHVPKGADPMGGAALGPGAFYLIPADLPHISSCISQSDCVTFLYQPGAFDFRPEGG